MLLSRFIIWFLITLEAYSQIPVLLFIVMSFSFYCYVISSWDIIVKGISQWPHWKLPGRGQENLCPSLFQFGQLYKNMRTTGFIGVWEWNLFLLANTTTMNWVNYKQIQFKYTFYYNIKLYTIWVAYTFWYKLTY